MSVLEFVGCVFAVVGGIWLGAVWLGLTMKEVTYTAAHQTGVWGHLPDNWRASIDPASDLIPPSPEFVANRLKEEYVAIGNEIDQLGFSGKLDNDQLRGKSGSRGATINASREATENYWNELSRIVYSEGRLQANAEAALAGSDSVRFYSIQARVNRYAADSVDALSQQEVDPRATLLGKQVAQWYRRAAELRTDAFETWATGDKSIRSPMEEARARTERQLQMETELLTAKAGAVREALSRQYGVEFSPLGDRSTD
jgi:hypothetical protein